MRTFCSPEGKKELETLRVTNTQEITQNAPPIALLAREPSEECGCPEELWRIDGMIYLIHLEANGTGEIFCFGDDEVEFQSPAQTLDDLRAEMFKTHAELSFDGPHV